MVWESLYCTETSWWLWSCTSIFDSITWLAVFFSFTFFREAHSQLWFKVLGDHVFFSNLCVLGSDMFFQKVTTDCVTVLALSKTGKWWHQDQMQCSLAGRSTCFFQCEIKGRGSETRVMSQNAEIKKGKTKITLAYVMTGLQDELYQQYQNKDTLSWGKLQKGKRKEKEKKSLEGYITSSIIVSLNRERSSFVN